jgi:ABC-type antimicrobial peptide transport system permease subunit
MMMISERAREFGILTCVGMKKHKLVIVTTLETIFVAFVGVIAGILGSIPVLYYFKNNPIRLGGEIAEIYDTLGIEPIMMFSTEIGIFTGQSLVVLIIALLTAIYPLIFIWKLKPVDALRA